MIRRRPWVVQPPAGTGIDWTHPLAQDLRFFYNGAVAPIVGMPCDAAYGAPPSAVSSGIKQHVGAAGVSMGWGVSGNYGQISYSPTPILEPSYVTILAYFNREATSSQVSIPFAKLYGTGSGSPYYSYAIQLDPNNAGQDYFRGVFAQNSTTARFTSSVIGHSLTIPAATAISYAADGTRCYQDGMLLKYDANTLPPLAYGDTPGNLEIGSSLLGNIYCAAVWGRALSNAEIWSISQNPWQMLAPQVLRA